MADHSREGRGSIVMGQFFRKKLALAGLVLVGLFLLVAAFAPFLAGNRPLLFDDGGGLSSPLFKAFTAEDFLWLCGVGIAAAFWLSGLWKISPRKRLLFASILAVIAIMIACLWPQKLDRSDYRPFRNGDREAGLALFPPVPFSPHEFDFSRRFEAPGAEHWLGMDSEGRDLLSRIIHGTRVSMLVGFVAVSIYVLIGIVIGALAGYFGGWTDLLLSRLVEIVICFPVFFAILAVLCFLPRSVFWIMVLIGILRWPGVARLTRGEFLRLKNEEFVSAGRALGLGHFRIIFLHMLPNGVAPVLVAATFGIAGAILLESGLSFLDMGADLSWGALLANAKGHIAVFWWLTLFPGIMIFTAVLSFNLVGEGLRDALDPRLRK